MSLGLSSASIWSTRLERLASEEEEAEPTPAAAPAMEADSSLFSSSPGVSWPESKLWLLPLSPELDDGAAG